MKNKSHVKGSKGAANKQTDRLHERHLIACIKSNCKQPENSPVFLFSSQRNPEFDQPCRTEAAESVARLFSPVEELVWICAGCSPSPCAGIQGDDDDDDAWTLFHLLLFGWPAHQGLDEFSPRSRERCQRIWRESSSTLSCSQGVLGTPIKQNQQRSLSGAPQTHADYLWFQSKLRFLRGQHCAVLSHF